jgi:hypothetical protein
MKNVNEVKATVENRKVRSAWDKGVKAYALELIETLTEAIERGYIDPEDLANKNLLNKVLLNGADSWEQYSYGGCALIYNCDIAERLCTPSEYKKSREGDRNPNRYETWLDVQARALIQAARMVRNAAF